MTDPRIEPLAEALIEFAYWEIAGEKMVTVLTTGPSQARVPAHWREEALDRARVYAQAVVEHMS
jgi:hypothetical protein